MSNLIEYMHNEENIAVYIAERFFEKNEERIWNWIQHEIEFQSLIDPVYKPEFKLFIQEMTIDEHSVRSIKDHIELDLSGHLPWIEEKYYQTLKNFYEAALDAVVQSKSNKEILPEQKYA